MSVKRLTKRKFRDDATKGFSDPVISLKVNDRLANIEDILGDDYDLDRLLELVEADRDGRCVVLPAGGYTKI